MVRRLPNKCRVLAIRPLIGCNEKHVKSLKVGELYKFYGDFEEVEQGLLFDSNYDFGMYGAKNLNVNISAVVGRNGTGKSTLLELLVIGLNNLAYSRFIPEESNAKIEFVEDAYLEFYFETDTIYKAKINGDGCFFIRYEFESGVYVQAGTISAKKFNFENFFYTVLVNYSLHGLNSEYTGQWLNFLFHKNDGYQTPVVIEPYRKKGNININRQEVLAKQRLLSNLLEVESKGNSAASLRILKPGIAATRIDLVKVFNTPKIGDDYYEIYINTSNSVGLKNKILEALFDSFDVTNVDSVINFEYEDIVDVAKMYLVKKLTIISSTYDEYLEYADYSFDLSINKSKLEEFVSRLHSDTSHVTYKLRQAINFLKYDIYGRDLEASLDIDDLSQKIARCMKNVSA